MIDRVYYKEVYIGSEGEFYFFTDGEPYAEHEGKHNKLYKAYAYEDALTESRILAEVKLQALINDGIHNGELKVLTVVTKEEFEWAKIK